MMGHLLDSGDVYSNRLVPEASTHSRGTTVKTRSKSGIRQTTTCKQACSRIRNKIRGYALKPEDIHPSRPASETSTDKIETTPRTGSRADIQLLVTCKQAYNEGHELFYSSNTFHLPPVETFSWSDRLAPKYKAMIKRISITIGLVELTPAMLTDIENRMPASVNHNDPDRCARYIVDILVRSWHSKLKTIADWDTLEEIELRSFGRTYLFPHREVAAVWKQCALVYGTGRFADILERSFFYDYLNISVKVILEGWQMTKKWLGEREPGEMAEPFIIGTAEPGGILDQLGFYTR